MPKLRKITNYKMALEQYDDYCNEFYQFKTGDRVKQEVNEEYSYVSKKQGYWYLRDSDGCVVANIEILQGKVFLRW